MRYLDDDFMRALTEKGFLNPILRKVIIDKDLDLQIRKYYINIYYKGNSILKLEKKSNQYKANIHDKFLKGTDNIKDLIDEKWVEHYLEQLPKLKENILIKGGKRSMEIEYEQLIIRSNNLEKRVNSEYFIIDRQYAAERENSDRFDLTGIYWSGKNRKRGQRVPLVCMEVKYSLNKDIQEIDVQLNKYYVHLEKRIKTIAEESTMVLKQKIELGIIIPDKERREALSTLSISDSINEVQFIVILVDYNPNSVLFERAIEKLKKLPFKNQIKIFKGGLAMWEEELRDLDKYETNHPSRR